MSRPGSSLHPTARRDGEATGPEVQLHRQLAHLPPQGRDLDVSFSELLLPLYIQLTFPPMSTYRQQHMSGSEAATAPTLAPTSPDGHGVVNLAPKGTPPGAGPGGVRHGQRTRVLMTS
jgi:hypothetical protein